MSKPHLLKIEQNLWTNRVDVNLNRHVLSLLYLWCIHLFIHLFIHYLWASAATYMDSLLVLNVFFFKSLSKCRNAVRIEINILFRQDCRSTLYVWRQNVIGCMKMQILLKEDCFVVIRLTLCCIVCSSLLLVPFILDGLQRTTND